MSINWERLYEINEKNNKKVGTKFEEIVREYLEYAYPHYTWKDTKSSWDDNHDFFVLFLENIWAEAKYKKDCTALKKEDIDPTIMSGTLDGNIRIIFFITNGYVPKTILNRIEKAGNVHSLNIICITRKQLEYWLILNPERYKHYFIEELSPCDKSYSAVLINNIVFIDQVFSNTNLLKEQPELLEGQYYTMNITIESNASTVLSFTYENCPFNFINAPNYASFDKIKIYPGIQQIQLLIYTTKCSDGAIPLHYSVSEEGNFVQLIHTIDFKIYPNKTPKITYDSQYVCSENLIKSLTNIHIEKGHVFTIAGSQNTGKSFVLKEILNHFYKTHQITYFKFYSLRKESNYMLFCRLIMFINFGDILKCFEVEEVSSTIDYYKTILKTKLDPIEMNIPLILEVFEGCYDEIIAKKISNQLTYNPLMLQQIIKAQRTPIPHIALIDELQNLNSSELDFLKNIINCSLTINNSVFLIAERETIYPESHMLFGLSRNDIEESLKNNLPNWPADFIHAVSLNFSNKPNLICENIILFKQWLADVPVNELPQRYLQFADNVKWGDFSIDLPLKYINILGIIYAFENGISLQAVLKLGICKDDIWFLCESAYVRYDAPKLLANMQLYRVPFEKKYASIYTEAVTGYLKQILESPQIFKNDVFLPEIYNLYHYYSNTELKNLSNKLQKDLHKYLYYADYLNLYIYSEIAFHYVNKKNPSDLTQEDLQIAFYYGIALMHCDRKRGAIEIFRWITNKASKQWDIYYMANCELFNSLYYRFEIRELDSEIILTQLQLKNKISKIIDEDKKETLNIRIAYSTCMNRAMMIAFLEDDYEKTQTIFDEYNSYHAKINKTKYKTKYLSMLGEWNLDYARGMVYKNPNIMLNTYTEYISMIGEKQNPKRYLMAKYNFSFIKCAYCGAYEQEKNNLDNLSLNFKDNGFRNEYLRSFIGNELCELVHLFKNPKFRSSKGLKRIIRKYKDNALSVEIDTMVYTNGRLAYQIRMYLAALEIFLGNYNTALSFLEENLSLIQHTGDSYKQLTIHNITNVNNIKSLAWAFEDSDKPNDTYLLDPRMW